VAPVADTGRLHLIPPKPSFEKLNPINKWVGGKCNIIIGSKDGVQRVAESMYSFRKYKISETLYFGLSFQK